MQVIVGMRLKAHARALLEPQVILSTSTQWLIRLQVNARNLWKLWSHTTAQLLQWMMGHPLPRILIPKAVGPR